MGRLAKPCRWRGGCRGEGRTGRKPGVNHDGRWARRRRDGCEGEWRGDGEAGADATTGETGVAAWWRTGRDVAPSWGVRRRRAPAGRCWGRWATEGRRAVSGPDFRAAPALQVFVPSKGAAHWPAALCVLRGMGLTCQWGGTSAATYLGDLPLLGSSLCSIPLPAILRLSFAVEIKGAEPTSRGLNGGERVTYECFCARRTRPWSSCYESDAGGREKGGNMACICRPDPQQCLRRWEAPFKLNGVSHLSSLIKTRSCGCCANIT